jgi:hypothetical protein
MCAQMCTGTGACSPSHLRRPCCQAQPLAIDGIDCAAVEEALLRDDAAAISRLEAMAFAHVRLAEGRAQ